MLNFECVIDGFLKPVEETLAKLCEEVLLAKLLPVIDMSGLSEAISALKTTGEKETEFPFNESSQEHDDADDQYLQSLGQFLAQLCKGDGFLSNIDPYKKETKCEKDNIFGYCFRMRVFINALRQGGALGCRLSCFVFTHTKSADECKKAIEADKYEDVVFATAIILHGHALTLIQKANNFIAYRVAMIEDWKMHSNSKSHAERHAKENRRAIAAEVFLGEVKNGLRIETPKDKDDLMQKLKSATGIWTEKTITLYLSEIIANKGLKGKWYDNMMLTALKKIE